MSDLAEQIRERLAQIGEHGGLRTAGAQVLHRALLAALDEHKPLADDSSKCGCIEYDDEYVANPYPDRTLVAIANGLGIEVTSE